MITASVKLPRGVGIMADYRCYFLDEDGHIQSRERNEGGRHRGGPQDVRSAAA
jgi:hypothetical protein